MLFGWLGHVTDLIIDLTTVLTIFGDQILTVCYHVHTVCLLVQTDKRQ